MDWCTSYYDCREQGPRASNTNGSVDQSWGATDEFSVSAVVSMFSLAVKNIDGQALIALGGRVKDLGGLVLVLEGSLRPAKKNGVPEEVLFSPGSHSLSLGAALIRFILTNKWSLP